MTNDELGADTGSINGMQSLASIPRGVCGRHILLWHIAAPDTQKEKDKKLMSALDAVNKRFGRGAVRFAAEGEADAPWQAKHLRKSPKYTSAWDELPIVGGKYKNDFHINRASINES